MRWNRPKRSRRSIGRVLAGLLSCEDGQSTVEAAFFLPILFGGMLLLIQPGLLLYDRVVMENAAAEGCRVLATSSASEEEYVKAYVKRRLGSIPPQDLFHVHGSGCTWKVALKGDQSSKRVSVKISTKVRPVPLLDFALKAVGATDKEGLLTVSVESEQATQPSWAFSSPAGADASAWVGAWLK